MPGWISCRWILIISGAGDGYIYIGEVFVVNRKISWGSFSILFFLLAVMFSVNIGRTLCLGDVILKAAGIKAWSRFHNTLFVSLALFAGGYILGRIFHGDEGARLGRNLCLIFGAGLVIVLAGGAFGVDLLYPLYSFPQP